MAPLLAAGAGSLPQLSEKTVSPFISETMCEYVALELLLPWRLRSEIEKMRDRGDTDHSIAEHCKVPQHWVTIALRSGYSEISSDLNKQLDETIGKDWMI
jgi:hypothetical protein